MDLFGLGKITNQVAFNDSSAKNTNSSTAISDNGLYIKLYESTLGIVENMKTILRCCGSIEVAMKWYLRLYDVAEIECHN